MSYARKTVLDGGPTNQFEDSFLWYFLPRLAFLNNLKHFFPFSGSSHFSALISQEEKDMPVLLV
jgi:hypothetical protein